MIKILAFLTMLIDHIGIIFFPDFPIFCIIGRLSFPLFAYGISVGYKYTHNYFRYAVRLLFLAIISQIPYYYLFELRNLNVCFTLLAGLVLIKIYDVIKVAWLRWTAILGVLFLTEILNCSYGLYGALTILIFHIVSDENIPLLAQAVLTFISVIVFRINPIQLIAALSPILIMFFKNINFKINRFIQYSFYPGHMLILLLIKYSFSL